ncbi:uncharacterized protein PV07_10018 [Cladophialophora immunda]|uniref:Uncharacterized protein n=1 Tax=Cladophialophora immunda TaxID=569365 RepID=A0A0D1Z9E1_9EURO|nr:uncharacterized protein PV07_10018 [Cladophialophora immunda]KIW24291.1 hypothetical protein PV07_10018 [Cladophialophora immunda]
MVNGSNCGFVYPLTDLVHHTCSCGDGYMNDEGTLIAGSVIKAGYALRRAEYHAHKDCKRCAVDALKCHTRRQQLSPSNTNTTITAPPDGIFEFFFPGDGVSESVLRAFLERNNLGSTTCLPGRRFMGENGFFVRSSFRLNGQDQKQLKALTLLEHRGEQWKGRLLRAAPPSRQPFNEFTSYLKLNPTTSPSTTQLLTTSPLTSAPKQSPQHQDPYIRRGVDNNDQVSSRYDRTSTEFEEDLSQVTSRASQMAVSGRRKERSPQPTPYGRNSKDSIQNPRNQNEDSYEIRQGVPPGFRIQGPRNRNESQQSYATDQRTESRGRSSRPQQGDSPNEEAAFSQPIPSEERFTGAEGDQRESGERHSSRPDPTRRSSTFHEPLGKRITPEAQTRSRHHAAVTRQDEMRHLDRDPRDSFTRRQESYSGSDTRPGRAPISPNTPATVYRRPTYGGPDTNYGHTTTPYSTTAYGTQSYGGPNTNYGAATTGYISPATTYSTSPTTAARNPIFKDLSRAEPRAHAYDIQKHANTPNQPASHIARATSPEPKSGIPQAPPVQRVRSSLPATDIDQEVLILYLKHYVDPKARITVDDRNVFVVEAARKLTNHEIEDITEDSKSWQREREKGKGRVSYQESETAQRRKRQRGGTRHSTA